MANWKSGIFSAFIFGVISCSGPQGQIEIKDAPDQQELRNEIAQLELKDSSQLIRVKGPYYRDRSGQLFERTFADREVKGSDTLVAVEYFNGKIPQEIDPLTFEQLDGWYAKDKNHVYYYRPTSGGMLCAIIEEADAETFKMLDGQYLYAVDSDHVYKETQILENIVPAQMIIKKGDKGNILSITSGKTVYTAE
jgi:hypothetical protein